MRESTNTCYLLSELCTLHMLCECNISVCKLASLFTLRQSRRDLWSAGTLCVSKSDFEVGCGFEVGSDFASHRAGDFA